MIKDGLWDAFHGYHMGNTAENVAERWQITREEQDRCAAASQRKAAAALQSGRFSDEIAPVAVKTRKGETVVDTDEYPRPDTTLEILAGLRPAFDAKGTVTAGNASGINDRSEEHTSELQSLMRISYAVFCLKKKNNRTTNQQ